MPFVKSSNAHVHEFIISKYIMCIYYKTKKGEISCSPCKGIKSKVVALDEVKWMLYTK